MSKTKDLHKLKIQKHNSRTWFLSHLWGCRIHCKYDQIGSKQTSTRTFKWSWSSPHHGGAKTKVGHCGWEVQLARIVSCQTHLRDLSAAIATATTKTITSTTTTTTTTNNNKQTNKKQNYTKNSNNNNNDSNSKEQNIWIAQEYEDLNTATPFVHQAVKSDLKELVVSVVEKCYQNWVCMWIAPSLETTWEVCESSQPRCWTRRMAVSVPQSGCCWTTWSDSRAARGIWSEKDLFKPKYFSVNSEPDLVVVVARVVSPHKACL